jgi:serine/threonine-protein kinase RsbW
MEVGANYSSANCGPEHDPAIACGKVSGMALVLIRSTAELGETLDRVNEALVQEGFSRRDQFGVRLALEEAIVNAVKHGNGQDPTKQVRFWWAVFPNGLAAVVEDEGPGFDVRQLADCRDDENLERPSGRGLLLMRSYMTWVRFNHRGNCVAMGKNRATSNGSR